MLDQGSGHIVNTASGAGLLAAPFIAAYATTKHAVVGLSLALRPECAAHGYASACCARAWSRHRSSTKDHPQTYPSGTARH
jgi:short-subunit dehydrogenase